MTTKLLATCDRILARMPIIVASPTEFEMGGIIVPEHIKKRSEGALISMEIESAGPSCSVARSGDTVIVNKNVVDALWWDGIEYAAFSEVTAFAIIKKVEPGAGAGEPDKPLTIEQIRKDLGLKSEITQDSDALPTKALP